MTATKLTDRQREIYTWLFAETCRRTYQPSMREMVERFGFSNATGALSHIKALAKKGYVSTNHKTARGLTLLRTPDGEPFDGFTPCIAF